MPQRERRAYTTSEARLSPRGAADTMAAENSGNHRGEILMRFRTHKLSVSLTRELGKNPSTKGKYPPLNPGKGRKRRAYADGPRGARRKLTAYGTAATIASAATDWAHGWHAADASKIGCVERLVPIGGTKLAFVVIRACSLSILFYSELRRILSVRVRGNVPQSSTLCGTRCGTAAMGRLSDRSAKTACPGRHVDGDGLHLVVSKNGRCKWVLRYQMNGARRDMGLGSYPSIGLAQARIAAADARKLILSRVDPITARKVARNAGKPAPTFQEIADIVVKDAQTKSGNAKVRYQWARHLGAAYCGPLLSRPVDQITTLDVAAVLRPIWREKPEVARKLYPAVRRVFEYARIRLRDDYAIIMPDNPARWDDLKAMGFEPPTKLSRGSYPSLPYSEIKAFMTELRARDAVAARALEFLVLTNLRTDAVLKARWEDIDLGKTLWTIPLENLEDRKHRKEGFRVPLSGRAIEILRQMKKVRTSAFAFPSHTGQPLSNMAMLTVLKRMNGSSKPKWIDPSSKRPITAHGFRATFRTWAEESTSFPHAVIEEAMGHTVGSQAERAYRRTDVLEKRRELMNAWARHCEPGRAGKTASVSQRRGARA